MRTPNKKFFFWVLGSIFGIALLALLLPPIGGPLRNARDTADMNNLRQVGMLLLMKADEEKVFPKSLSSLRNNITDSNLLPFLDEKQTSYSRPASYPPDKEAILLARPIEHGMIVFYVNGSLKQYIYKKQNSESGH